MNILSEHQKTIRTTVILMLSIAIGFIFYVLLAQISGYITVRDFQPNPLGQLKILLLKSWLPWLLLSPLMVVIVKRFPINPDNWIRLAFIHVALLLLLSLLQGSIISYHYHFFEKMNGAMVGYRPWQHIGHFLFGDSLLLFNMIIYMAFIASFNLRNFYNIAQQRALETTNLAYKLTESKLHALRMQINPHFLFNTLNVISVLVMKKENDKATDMIEKLCSFFRQTLTESTEQWVPLAQELTMISQYLAIEQLRFGDRLTVEQHCDREVMQVLVPSMILQPLVENAMSHGLGEKQQPGKLTINCVRQADKLLIQIIDDGVGCAFEQDPHFKAGVGLTNVKQRLQQMYQHEQVFNIKGVADQGVTVTIELPINPMKQTI